MLKPTYGLYLWSESSQKKEPHEAGRLSWGSVYTEEAGLTGERITLTYKADQDLPDISLYLSFQDKDWSREDYLLVPAAVYDGNRFRIRKVPYAPMFRHEDYELDPPITSTDIPHFSKDAEESVISLRAGDSAIPGVFWYDRSAHTGRALLYECRSKEGALGENGVVIRESAAGLAVCIMDPIVRADGMYRFGDISSTVPCMDPPGRLEAGQTATLTVEQYCFDASDLMAFFHICARLMHRSQPLAGPRTIVEPALGGIPTLRGGFRLVEQKYNTYSWRPDPGFYMTGEGTNLYSTWQTGWVGGINPAYALYRGGNPVSRDRAKQTMDFMFRTMQAESGFFYGMSDGVNLYGDDFADINDKAFTMVRKNADALYFAAQILLLMKQRRDIPDALWVQGLRKAADAFVRLFDRHGQVGQFIDVETEEIRVGGSCAGGLVPAGLLLAAAYFDEPQYRQTACRIAEWLDQTYVQKGLIGGGPGEILSAPDSESAYAVLESFVSLYEATDDDRWLEAAVRAADQYATWTMAYDYPFPKESMFGEAGMHTTGAVWANVQNKHGAPGPCTFSGSALLRLAKYANDPLCRRIGEETIRNITQYLSRANRPLWNYDHTAASPPGFMCERVSTSDWEGFDKIGGVYETGCWCEATVLLMATDPQIDL